MRDIPSAATGRHSAVGDNVRRLMARAGLTFEDVVEAAQLDERTIRGLMRGTNRPHARTLHKLAAGLGVSIDELFSRAAGREKTEFDHASNPIIETVVAAHPHLFAHWDEHDFAELASRFGVGGQLNEEGALAAAQSMNAKRAVLEQAAVILESDQADLLSDFVQLLYRRATTEPEKRSATDPDR